jgi:tetratricopeptide (TPR) repeat protein
MNTARKGYRELEGWQILALAFAWAASASGGQEKTLQSSVVKIVGQIQRADYAGDRPELGRLYGKLLPFTKEETLASRVRYWRGFAMWRQALNGFNESAERKELEPELELAVDEFKQAIELDPNFVDAKVGAAACLLNLLFLNKQDSSRVRELLSRAIPLLNEAKAAAPENPRLLWVLGASAWYNPPERGGGQAKALAAYQLGLEAERKNSEAPSDPLAPSWGKAELLMNLAWANLNRTTPDLEAAEKYARKALAQVPYWHYVHDILLPQIKTAKSL